uniref:PORR domain-containing protein n=1 Tax=Salix viminalis TaxID=40686 RepID=A0A6N2KB70_SALVM
MQFLFRSLPKPLHHGHRRGLVDFAAIKHVRDRGLDHAVEREKHLKPVLAVKNLIKSEPSKSLPISIITQQKDFLKIPIRPIELIRRYPSVFQEFLPGGIGIHPHVKLTQQVLDLDIEEQLVYKSENYKNDVANRLLKLLMISRIDKIPLKLLDLLLWDLGLPQDCVKSLVPEFPDYFRVLRDKNLSPGSGSDLGLELVCWSNELAVSVMEKKVKSRETSYVKGMPIEFPMQFSTGFEVDKRLKQWISDWQKLPYVSPYENAIHLGPNTDESDRWAVGVLHEVLHLSVSKKVEKDTLLCLGEWLGIRSRFKRALLHHPGIFYLSNKIGTYTAVLKEGYKRGLLVEKNPVVDIRNQYIHLMHTVVEENKSITVHGGSQQQEKKIDGKSEGQGEKQDAKDCVEVTDAGSDFEGDSEDGYEYDEEEDEGESRKNANRNTPINRGRADRKKNLDVRGNSRHARRERGVEKHHGRTRDKVLPKDDYKSNDDEDKGESRTHAHTKTPRGRVDDNKSFNGRGRSRNVRRERVVERHHGKTRDKARSKDDYMYNDDDGEEGEGKRRARINSSSSRGRGDKNNNLNSRGHARIAGRDRGIEKRHFKTKDKFLPKNSIRKEMSRGYNFKESSQ